MHDDALPPQFPGDPASGQSAPLDEVPLSERETNVAPATKRREEEREAAQGVNAADAKPPKARRSKLKIMLFVLAGGMGLLVLALVVAIWQIDAIGRAAIEEGGSAALGVETKLEKLRLSVFDGECHLENLTIANPEGFSAPHFFKMERAEMALTLGSVTEQRIVAPYFRMHGIDLNLQKGDEMANYEVILENLKKLESEPDATDPEATEPPESKPTETGSAEPAIQFVIEEVVLTDIRVKAELSLTGLATREYDIRIDEIRLQNVGSETEGGSVVAELWGTIMKAVLSAVLRAGADILPDVMKDGLGAGLKGLRSVGGATIHVAGESVGLVVDVAGEGVDAAVDGVEAVGKGVGGVLKGIGGLFGGKKKKTEDKTEDKSKAKDKAKTEEEKKDK